MTGPELSPQGTSHSLGYLGGGGVGVVMGVVGRWEVSPTSKEEAVRGREKNSSTAPFGIRLIGKFCVYFSH